MTDVRKEKAMNEKDRKRLKSLELATRRVSKDFVPHEDEDVVFFLSEERRGLTKKEESFLHRILQDGLDGEKLLARQIFCQANLRLVVKFVRHYRSNRNRTPFADLLSEGYIGLNRAVNLFDPKEGRFTTYASHWINQAVQRAIGFDTLIHIPVNVGDAMRRVEKITERLTQDLGRKPDFEEIADESGLPVEIIIQLMVRTTQPSSAGVLVCTTDDEKLLDRWESVPCSSESPFQQTSTRLLHHQVEQWLKMLDNPRQVLVLCRRFGLDGAEEFTQEAIGIELGVSRERVRQLEKQALNILRERIPQSELDDLLDLFIF